ncbi:MAG: hypothetical protein LBD32_00455 [Cytophagales bacterium]|jgi:chromosome segregation ATPase|nr:hypothetical protein [Cytophagales bacterium]
MKYNKNTYLQILKSFGILSSSFTVCSCGNNDFSSRYDDEKISAEEIISFVTERLTCFGDIDENLRTKILAFFSSNVEYFQEENILERFFEKINSIEDLNYSMKQWETKAAIKVKEQELAALKLQQQTEIEEQINTCTKQLEALQQELKNLQERKTQLKSELDENNAQIKNVMEQIKSLNTYSKGLQTQLKKITIPKTRTKTASTPEGE